jgi:predicted DNA-binding transcriptional regulator AlpA
MVEIVLACPYQLKIYRGDIRIYQKGRFMESDFITIEECVQLTGLTREHLAALRYRGRGGPPFRKPTPRTVRYRRSEVLEWMDANPQTQTGQPARVS